MLAQFSSTFHTLENQFEQGSGRFVDPEPPFKMGPQIRAPKKKTKTPKKKKTWNQTLISAERSLFATKKKLFLVSMALGGQKKNENPKSQMCKKTL